MLDVSLEFGSVRPVFIIYLKKNDMINYFC